MSHWELRLKVLDVGIEPHTIQMKLQFASETESSCTGIVLGDTQERITAVRANWFTVRPRPEGCSMSASVMSSLVHVLNVHFTEDPFITADPGELAVGRGVTTFSKKVFLIGAAALMAIGGLGLWFVLRSRIDVRTKDERN